MHAGGYVMPDGGLGTGRGRSSSGVAGGQGGVAGGC